MVTSGLSIKLFDFQEEAVIKLIDLTSKKDSKQTIIMKAPTGSGKTIILIDYVDKYLTNVSANTAFIWLCPGKGNLEEQSREKMMKFVPSRKTQNLFDALLNGFAGGSTTFINWELVTKRGNIAIRDSERKNLYDRIADAHRSGVEFIVIIDEEHSNNTAKAKEIAARYKDNGKNIRPLVLIQFPNGRPETITAVEQKLESMGYSYDNGMVSKWMSEDKKDLPDNLTKNDGIPVFLLMKQAISTGWDCPRAKILVKLREGMSESFEIQTIGRIRRMPEAKHYEDDLLDFCYVYTFDEKYKAGLLSNMDKAYETRRLFLKNECKTFTLEKEIRDLDIGGLGERDVLNKIYDALVKNINLLQTKQIINFA